MVPHYSTPISKSPNEEEYASSHKRSHKFHSLNAKRTKSNDSVNTNNKNSSVAEQDVVNSGGQVSEEETDYIEVPNLKIDSISLEQDETKDPLKQLLGESNGNTSAVDASAQDNGRCFFFSFFD